MFLLSLLLATYASSKQPTATDPSAWPYRPLEWGELNIIHTTDTHSWLGGHLHSTYPEPLYSGDFGDYYSFVQHMKLLAEDKGVDLLLVDSGDMHDGNGLGDADPIIRGHRLLTEYWTKMGYDILAIGNHEMYDYDVAYDVHTSFVPSLPNPETYLASNANITFGSSSADPRRIVSSPVGGNRVRHFQTARGRKITAFGVLFGFETYGKGLMVQAVEDMVAESWFIEAIEEKPDAFILAGHMDVRDSDWEIVVSKIRQRHPYIPVLVLGGHHHVRDCRQIDGRSMSLASGRYMETVGFMSVSGFEAPEEKNLTFSRRYLDANRNSYMYHTDTTEDDFDTEVGKEMSAGLWELGKEFNISYSYGEAPHAYWLNRYPVSDERSVTQLLVGKVFPSRVSSPTRKDVPHLIIFNVGGVRYDIYAGPFTNNDQYITMPFKNEFLFVPDVDPHVATQMLNRMNEDGASRRRRQRRALEVAGGRKEKRDVQLIFQEWREDMYYRWQSERLPDVEDSSKDLTDGYVTFDSCPGLGDDIKHRPIPVVPQPDFAATALPPTTEPVDIVFFDFIWPDILATLNKLQNKKTYTFNDILHYNATVRSHTLLKEYASFAWN
ncbi:hypothetical protein BT69DRAFT_1239417 [Atractiella rhizophila]|nr:hypothetical protein BT69DRAFT_1239417 [Atractiella rhizophila]